MSDFKFECRKCGQSILCDSSNAGMQIPCPACQTMLTVPPPPPAVPAAHVPGKLAISKTAAPAHHQPPPGAAGGSAKPAWGAKPIAPVAPKRKFPVKAVSATAGVLAVLAVGWFAFGAPYLKKYQDEQKQKQEEADRQAAEQARAAAEAAKPKPPKAVWKLDLANAKFPDHPAAGKLHGVDFTVETVIFQNGVVTLRQDSGSTRQFVIGLPLKSGETIPEKSFQVSSTNTLNQPKVILNWKEDSPKPPGAQAFSKGYALKLEFGPVADGKVPGKIYLSVPDPEQSFVAGNLEIGPRKIPPPPGAGAPPPPGMSPSGLPGGPPPRRPRPPG